jgi:hypothetical protein
MTDQEKAKQYIKLLDDEKLWATPISVLAEMVAPVAAGTYVIVPVKLLDYCEHDENCICSFWEAGMSTADGGYLVKYKGTWYQYRPVDKTPKCDCGLHELMPVNVP